MGEVDPFRPLLKTALNALHSNVLGRLEIEASTIIYYFYVQNQ